MVSYATIAIVVIIFLLAVTGYQMASGSGWGPALWNALGFFGALLGSFLRNPLLWLLGIALLYLLGPAVLKIGADALKKLYDKVTAAEEEDGDLAPDDRLSGGEKAVTVEKLLQLAATESIDSSNMGVAEKANARAAAAARFKAARGGAVARGEVTEAEAADAEDFADDVWEGKGTRAARLAARAAARGARPRPRRS